MPYTGLFQFLPMIFTKKRRLSRCINALYGPFSISTVTPEKWLIFVVFQGWFYT